MAVSSKTISVTFIIATLNSGRVLTNCLRSIHSQIHPGIIIKILVVDGGSSDNTLTIAKQYKCQIKTNPLKTAEAAKALGIAATNTEYIALIDSDNILPSTTWLKNMLEPLLKDKLIIGSEPWSYTYRPNGGFIERYSSLTGINDPYCLTVRNYDRQNILSGRWTGLSINITDFDNYQSFTLIPGQLFPTIGANGTIYRTEILKKYFSGDYFFDTDFINHIPIPFTFAKVKTGIIHTFCESSISKFYRKQIRRVKDLYQFSSSRVFSPSQNNFFNSIKFSLYVVTILPVLFDTFKGCLKKPDSAWLFHPLACIITLYAYGTQTILYYMGLNQPQTRTQWQQ
jgi:glycosyltransferase involved in cell wall biosynthesis